MSRTAKIVAETRTYVHGFWTTQHWLKILEEILPGLRRNGFHRYRNEKGSLAPFQRFSRYFEPGNNGRYKLLQRATKNLRGSVPTEPSEAMSVGYFLSWPVERDHRPPLSPIFNESSQRCNVAALSIDSRKTANRL